MVTIDSQNKLMIFINVVHIILPVHHLAVNIHNYIRIYSVCLKLCFFFPSLLLSLALSHTLSLSLSLSHSLTHSLTLSLSLPAPSLLPAQSAVSWSRSVPAEPEWSNTLPSALAACQLLHYWTRTTGCACWRR